MYVACVLYVLYMTLYICVMCVLCMCVVCVMYDIVHIRMCMCVCCMCVVCVMYDIVHMYVCVYVACVLYVLCMTLYIQCHPLIIPPDIRPNRLLGQQLPGTNSKVYEKYTHNMPTANTAIRHPPSFSCSYCAISHV